MEVKNSLGLVAQERKLLHGSDTEDLKEGSHHLTPVLFHPGVMKGTERSSLVSAL